MATAKKAKGRTEAPAEIPADDGKETVCGTPAQEAVQETAGGPVQETAGGPVQEVPAQEPGGDIRERLAEILARGMADDRCPPSLVQFEQKGGRPCTVLVECDASAVREAWEVWTAERGRGQEEFVMALLDAGDAWPAKIMRPCTPVRLE